MEKGICDNTTVNVFHFTPKEKMEKLEIAYLYVYYGNLLNAHQSEIMRLYYDCDMSLAEIANHIKITRQGVREVLIRSANKLMVYEQKLGLVKKVRAFTVELETIIKDADEKTSLKLKQLLAQIKEL